MDIEEAQGLWVQGEEGGEGEEGKRRISQLLQPSARKSERDAVVAYRYSTVYAST
jgi:hypothetical protein